MISTILKTLIGISDQIRGKLKRRWLNFHSCDIHPRTFLAQGSKFHSVKIGFGTYVSTNARISDAEIGKFCSIGPNFICGHGIHPITGLSTSPVFYSTQKQAGFTLSKEDKVEERLKICIGNDVFIGTNVVVLDGIKIGDGAVIGAGAVVSKDIPPYAVAAGCPIKIIRFRFEQEQILELMSIKWWDQNELVLQDVEKYFFCIDEFIRRYKVAR